MRIDKEPDTDVLTLTLDDGSRVYLPTTGRDLWCTVKPYMPDRNTPWRILVSFVQSLAVGLVAITALGFATYLSLNAGILLGPVMGVVVFIILCGLLWELSGKIVERMLVTDDLSISRFKRTTEEFTD